MENPEPPNHPNRWVPTNKLIGGAVISQAAAQIIVAVCDQYFSHPLTPELATAISTLCYAIGAYFIPNRPTS
jgi:hypothetical protein